MTVEDQTGRQATEFVTLDPNGRMAWMDPFKAKPELQMRIINSNSEHAKNLEFAKWWRAQRNSDGTLK